MPDLTPARLAALSLVGLSCAGLNPPAVSRDRVRSASTEEARPTLVSEAALGGLTMRKWRLANGLQVLLLPDPSATSVAYTTWFRVGSRHEDAAAGETGLAHLFEHLMFTQTRSAKAVGEFDRRMEAAGASTNAMTSHDFTAYQDQIPPGAVSLAIELEADRMMNLALTDEQVETEREVVVEERLGSVEDSVDGVLEELLYGRAFRGHPYRYPVIGRMEDIRAVTREKAVRFYQTFYAPNNAVLVVAGRFDPEAVLAAIAAGYGALPAATALPPDRAQPERAPSEVIRVEVERPVPADRLALGFPSPALGDAERAAFEVLDEILTGGPSARLHRRLVVEGQIASSVDAGAAPTRDPGLYTLWVQLRKGHGSAEAEKAVDQELADLAARPVSAAELQKAKNRLETDFWRGLASSEGRADQLGEFEVVTGDYRNLLTRAEEISRVTAEAVQRVARDYLGGAARVVAVARPSKAAGSPRASGT